MSSLSTAHPLMRLVSRRKLRTVLLRCLVFLLSVSCLLFLFARHRSREDALPAVEEKVYSHSVIHKELSAKQLLKFARLYPVVKGWGELGSAVQLKTAEEEAEAKKLFPTGAFNVYVSDRIAFNRSLPDARPAECAKIAYDIKGLGSTSVVIIFTDEIWSALIRTIWSVWNRTPDVLLLEIILVDDFSTKDYLKQDLEDYCGHYFGSKVKILRTAKRQGLIRARLMGAEAATGDVLVFLDSHCEVTVGWLEPMLELIRADRNTVVCPVIDVIDDKTLAYSAGVPESFQIGGFTWSGHFTWIDIPADEQATRLASDPVKSPTMAGGLFAIERRYFFESGSYDEKMEIWGGENLEMSFRIWQCGGTLLIHPCSHVGHIFRDYHPYSFNGKDTHGFNTLRTILIWMDKEYHEYFFMYRPELRLKNVGDLADRLTVKESLKCKSFRWYLENVYRGRKRIFDRNVVGHGFVRNPITNLCLDTLNEDEEKPFQLHLYRCETRAKFVWTNQVFSLSTTGELFREDLCVMHYGAPNKVMVTNCMTAADTEEGRKQSSTQQWTHTKGGQIINRRTGKCLTTRGAKSSEIVRIDVCDENDPHQIWWFQFYSDLRVARRVLQD